MAMNTTYLSASWNKPNSVQSNNNSGAAAVGRMASSSNANRPVLFCHGTEKYSTEQQIKETHSRRQRPHRKRVAETIVIADDSPCNGGSFPRETQVIGNPAPVTNVKQESSNDGADSAYDYKITAHEILRSITGEYEVLEFLGRGTFGQVVKCWKRHTNQLVAVKISKDHPSYKKQAEIEVNILSLLMQEDSEAYNFVRAIECFTHKNHTCVVFEMLQQNLYDFLRSSKFRPLPLKYVRPILHQVATTLLKLKSMGLIHSDLKPENIMLVDQDRQPYRVKVVDFGSATHRAKAVASSYLQSRYYRAPEIILGLPFNEAIDMWSLGCVAAELFLGWPLFPGPSEYDQIRYIIQTEGHPDQHLLHSSAPSKRNRYFKQVMNALTRQYEWVLKSQDEYERDSGKHRREEGKRYSFKKLDEIALVTLVNLPSSASGADMMAEKIDRAVFVDLLKRMLDLNPERRITPGEVLRHPFFTFTHLSQFCYCQHVQSSIHSMDMIAYYKSQAIAQRNSTTIPCSLPSAQAQEHKPTEIYYPETHQQHIPTHAHSNVYSRHAPLLHHARDTYHRNNHQGYVNWKTVAEDVGYISAEPSPSQVLLRSPHCRESSWPREPDCLPLKTSYACSYSHVDGRWNNSINAVPVPSWRLHFPNQKLSHHGVPSVPIKQELLDAAFLANSRHCCAEQQLRRSPIFVADSPSPSRSVITVSSSSEEDTTASDITPPGYQPNTCTNYTIERLITAKTEPVSPPTTACLVSAADMMPMYPPLVIASSAAAVLGQHYRMSTTGQDVAPPTLIAVNHNQQAIFLPQTSAACSMSSPSNGTGCCPSHATGHMIAQPTLGHYGEGAEGFTAVSAMTGHATDMRTAAFAAATRPGSNNVQILRPCYVSPSQAYHHRPAQFMYPSVHVSVVDTSPVQSAAGYMPMALVSGGASSQGAPVTLPLPVASSCVSSSSAGHFEPLSPQHPFHLTSNASLLEFPVIQHSTHAQARHASLPYRYYSA